MPRQHRIAIMGAFAVAICEGRFLTPGDGPLAKKSVKGTINAAAAMRPSKKTDKKTPFGTRSAMLGNFYSGN
jgi:hypothetical protein